MAVKNNSGRPISIKREKDDGEDWKPTVIPPGGVYDGPVDGLHDGSTVYKFLGQQWFAYKIIVKGNGDFGGFFANMLKEKKEVSHSKNWNPLFDKPPL